MLLSHWVVMELPVTGSGSKIVSAVLPMLTTVSPPAAAAPATIWLLLPRLGDPNKPLSIDLVPP